MFWISSNVATYQHNVKNYPQDVSRTSDGSRAIICPTNLNDFSRKCNSDYPVKTSLGIISYGGWHIFPDCCMYSTEWGHPFETEKMGAITKTGCNIFQSQSSYDSYQYLRQIMRVEWL